MRNIAGFEKKYEATNTAVAIHPTVSAIDRLDRFMNISPVIDFDALGHCHLHALLIARLLLGIRSYVQPAVT
jgi:hypothetical protein